MAYLLIHKTRISSKPYLQYNANFVTIVGKLFKRTEFIKYIKLFSSYLSVVKMYMIFFSMLIFSQEV